MTADLLLVASDLCLIFLDANQMELVTNVLDHRLHKRNTAAAKIVSPIT